MDEVLEQRLLGEYPCRLLLCGQYSVPLARLVGSTTLFTFALMLDEGTHNNILGGIAERRLHVMYGRVKEFSPLFHPCLSHRQAGVLNYAYPSHPV